VSVGISVIILTYNDEENIGACLKSLKDFVADIVIVDSFSEDRTLEICRNFGCRIFRHDFINQAHQFNWALDSIPLKHQWVLRLDSDEILPERLKREMERRVGKEDGIAGYYINRRMYWMNRWLRHGRMYPHYILRLFRFGSGRYEMRTEEHLLLNGKAAYLEHDFLEDNRKNSLEYLIVKHLKTAEGELSEILYPRHDEFTFEPSLFGTKTQRTRWLKENVYARTPLFARSLLYFIYRYLICLGFLDGKEGLIFHFLQAFWYRFYIDARLFEERLAWRKSRINHTTI
jgi:glycosyltransferase involved in cell wall biosynthesis